MSFFFFCLEAFNIFPLCWVLETYYNVSLYLWAFLIAQLVKNLPAMQETLVQFLGWENLLEKG